MLAWRFIVCMCSIGAIPVGTEGVFGQEYPSKPIRIITAPVGGSGDFVSRQVAQGLVGPLGQAVVVENRGGGVVPIEAALKVPPDGYALLVIGNAFWITPLLQKTSFDPVRDFMPISLLARQPNVLALHPSLPARSVKELIALAKAKPGEINVVSGTGAGSSSVISAELFKAMANVNIVRVAYKGTLGSIGDLLSGQVHMTFELPSLVMPYASSGRLRALAVTSAEPSALVPGLPPVASTLPGFEVVPLTGMFAPARTPGNVIKRINQEVSRFLNAREVKERFVAAGVESVGNSPEELMAAIKADMERVGKIIHDANLRAN